jgi:cell division protein FtsB
MRSIEDIATTGAAWVTEAELAMLCAFAKRAEASEAELERLRAELDRPRYETLRQLADAVERNEQLNAEVERLRARLELYDDGLTPEAVRALIVRRGL